MHRFSLPALQIQTILDGNTVSKRRRALKTIPKELRGAFGKSIERIQRQSSVKAEQAINVLKWTFLAERPLSITELRHTLSVIPENEVLYIDNLPAEKSILECCLGLVVLVVDDGQALVRFVHKSLQDYLEEEGKSLFPDGHAEIASICATYMDFRFSSDLDGLPFLQVVENLAFLKYATMKYVYHARKQISYHRVDEIVTSVLRPYAFRGYTHSKSDEYWTSECHWVGNIVIKHSMRSARWQLSALHLAAKWGSVAIMQAFLKDEDCVKTLNTKSAKDDTPLSRAIYLEHNEVVRLLLKTPGIDVNKPVKEGGSTPLMIAAMRDNISATQLLLEQPDISVDMLDRHGSSLLRFVIFFSTRS